MLFYNPVYFHHLFFRSRTYFYVALGWASAAAQQQEVVSRMICVKGSDGYSRGRRAVDHYCCTILRGLYIYGKRFVIVG